MQFMLMATKRHEFTITFLLDAMSVTISSQSDLFAS